MANQYQPLCFSKGVVSRRFSGPAVPAVESISIGLHKIGIPAPGRQRIAAAAEGPMKPVGRNGHGHMEQRRGENLFFSFRFGVSLRGHAPVDPDPCPSPRRHVSTRGQSQDAKQLRWMMRAAFKLNKTGPMRAQRELWSGLQRPVLGTTRVQVLLPCLRLHLQTCRGGRRAELNGEGIAAG